MKKSLKSLIKAILTITVICLTSCASNKLSFYKTGEKVDVRPIKIERDSSQTDVANFDKVLKSVAPEILNIGIKGITSLIDKETKKYTQKYKGQLKNSNFYFNNPSANSPAELNYSGFSVKRTVKPTKEIINETATQIEFEFIQDELTKTMLAIKPKNLVINSTKAKLRQNDTTVDVSIKITIKSFWTSETNGQRTFNSKKIVDTEFSFKDVVLEKQYSSKDKKLQKQSSWFSAIPYSLVPSISKLDKGVFELTIEVIESDDMEKRLKKISKKFKGSEDLLQSILKGILAE